MPIKLSDFERDTNPGRVLDFEKILNLDDTTFARFYQELMAQRWSKATQKKRRDPVNCAHCLDSIEDPLKIVPYAGSFYHSGCFEKFWGEERKDYETGNSRVRFWDRVAKIINPNVGV